jgi:Domain of unknown function (DUF1851)
MEPIFSSPFGDVFFRAADGIWWLDTIEGSISRRWTSKEALRAEIDTVAGQDDYLLAGLVLAEARGLRPGPDQVFDFAVAPVLGGSFETDNIVVVDFVVKLTIAGQLHDQLRQLPPGRQDRRHRGELGPPGLCGFVEISDLIRRQCKGQGASIVPDLIGILGSGNGYHILLLEEPAQCHLPRSLAVAITD